MSGKNHMFDLLSTLFFAGIAVFIAFRLYTTLGRREGHMEPPSTETMARQAVLDEPQSHLRPAFEGRAAVGLEAIAAADSAFHPDNFIAGARTAYKMIVEAFARGDISALRPLLADKVYQRYADAITGREARGETVRTEIERIKAAEITEASHADHLAKVKVSFEAEIATETLDKDGQRISGDLATLNTVRENWVFERRTDRSDPNWVLSGVAAV